MQIKEVKLLTVNEENLKVIFNGFEQIIVCNAKIVA
jgi:hypothetical protein